MRRVKFRVAFAVIVLLCMLRISSALSQGASWSVLVYMLDSNLNDLGFAQEDILEMIACDKSEGNLEFLVCTREDLKDIGRSDCCIYRIGDEIELLSSFEDTDMGDARTLQSFLLLCEQQGLKENAMLIFWNHGHGSLLGLGEQIEEVENVLRLREIQSALCQISMRFELIGFDACLMACMETAQAVSGATDYMLASQETIPGSGWNYRSFSQLLKCSDGAQAGALLAEAYAEHYLSKYRDFPEFAPYLTLSCLDLSRLKLVREASEVLFSKMNKVLATGDFDAIAKARGSAKSLGRITCARDYDLMDLGSLAATFAPIAPHESLQLQQALEEMVICCEGNVEGVTGVSVYLPELNQQMYAAYFAAEYIPFSEAYRTFVEVYASQLRGEQVPVDNQRLPEECSYQLTAQELKELQAASAILYFVSDDIYGVLGMQRQLMPDADGKLRYVFEDEALYVCSDQGQVVLPLLDMENLKDGTIRAGAEGILFHQDASILNVHVEVSVKDDRAQIVRVSPKDMNRGSVDLREFDALLIGYGGYVPTYGEDGELLPFVQWDTAEQVCFDMISIDGPITLQKQPFPENMQLYAQFQMRTIHGELRASELIPIVR